MEVNDVDRIRLECQVKFRKFQREYPNIQIPDLTACSSVEEVLALYGEVHQEYLYSQQDYQRIQRLIICMTLIEILLDRSGLTSQIISSHPTSIQFYTYYDDLIAQIEHPADVEIIDEILHGTSLNDIMTSLPERQTNISNQTLEDIQKLHTLLSQKIQSMAQCIIQ